jgi:hypothetical protein
MKRVFLANDLPARLQPALKVRPKLHPGPGAGQMPSLSTTAPHGPEIIG